MGRKCMSQYITSKNICAPSPSYPPGWERWGGGVGKMGKRAGKDEEIIKYRNINDLGGLTSNQVSKKTLPHISDCLGLS